MQNNKPQPNEAMWFAIHAVCDAPVDSNHLSLNSKNFDDLGLLIVEQEDCEACDLKETIRIPADSPLGKKFLSMIKNSIPGMMGADRDDVPKVNDDAEKKSSS